MNVHQKMRLALLSGLILGASQLAAQSVTIIGSGEEARRCKAAADIAANMQIAADGDLEDCNFAIRQGRLTTRDLAATYSNRGIIEVVLERYQEAFEDYGTAIQIMPDLPEPYVGRGNVYFIANKLDEAIEHYNKAMSLELGKMHIAFLNRGLAYEAQGRLAEAENDYRKAIELAPEWTLAQEKLERVLAKRQP
jgi:tetratricopeptide (TPR) repeat protein